MSALESRQGPRRARRWAIALTAAGLTASIGVAGWVMSTAVSGDLLTNGSFDSGTSGTGWSTTDPAGVEVWVYANMTQYIPWTQNMAGYDGPNFAEINASSAGTLYQDVATTPGDVLTWQLAHRARAGNSGTDVMKVLAGPGGGSGATGLTAQVPLTKDGVTLNPSRSNPTYIDDTGAAWGLWTGSYTVPPGQTLTRFGFQAVSSASGNPSYGNFLDGIAFGNLGKTGVVVTAASPTSITVNQSVPSIAYTTNAATTSSDWTTEPTCAVYAQSDSSYTTPLTGQLAAGTYVTRCSGGTSATYYPSSFVNGTLTVTKIPVTVTAASPATLTPGSSVPTITYATNPSTSAGDWTSQPTCGVYAASDTSFATPLTGTLSAGTYVTHCSGGTSNTYNPTSYADGTLVVAAPAPSGGGGGGGTGSAPASAPVAEPPADPVPAPPPAPKPVAAPLGSLDPIANQQNTSVPPAGLPAGASLLLVNGVPTSVTVVPNAPQAPTGLEVTGDGWRMKLVGHGDDADPLGLTEKQVLILQSDQTPGARSGEIGRVKVKPVARASGDGFKSNSPVRFYLLPKTYLGQLMNNDQGSFAGDIPVPPGIKPGAYTLQMNGYGPDSSVRSLSIGVIVKPTAGRILTVRTAVFFDPLSPELSAASKKALAAVAKRARSGATKAVVVGYVQPTSITHNDESLSQQRARNVAAYLKSIGLGGTYDVSGDGVAKQTDATARRVNVTVTYRG
ncbi:MAG: OmpA family protein [Actinomycetales bacterium]|nr:OmpA family protein [Actinomycetales bacterium]